MTIITEPIPGYNQRVKTEVNVNLDSITVSRVLDSDIYKLELEIDSIRALEKVTKLDNETFKLLARAQEDLVAEN